ncbi:16S rRNA (adenine(1518)-N(6)/adenine(1519)-N(6))-dimethyltransferase RsmA [Planctomicrobium sp. SH527]|uniref:16S rRNA (adenine(1518)-N(6)/adenine(1519)-N(6))- dimethyltransferase RsmA n=1 Tax=Planctomicrobium sp. SH527 TaxID=3448123 RepID=UPI003F5CB44B
MDRPERQTRSYLMQLFQRHGYHPRTNLGQNFLIDINIIDFVVRSAELTKDDVVLEIGAGTGGMTTFMAYEAGHVISVEIDRNMFELASEATQKYNNVTLINADALKNKNNFNPVVLEEIQKQLAVSPKRRLKMVANLPYSVATPVISNLVATELPWERMVVTIQYEVGSRMQAKAGEEHYGALSVWLQSQCQVELLKKLGPTVFWPRPKVDSAVVQLVPDPEARARLGNREFFHGFVRRVFNYRRKFLRSVLVGMHSKQLEKPEVDAVLAELGFSETTRAEALDIATHIELAKAFQKAIERKFPGELPGLDDTAD